MGDHARREMIVRAVFSPTEPGLQTDCLIVYKQPPREMLSGVVCISRILFRSFQMQARQYVIGPPLAWFILACGGTHNAALPTPVPVPESSTPERPPANPQHHESLSFHYAPGAFTYSILRTATVQNTDSGTDIPKTFTSAGRDSLIFESSDQGSIIKAIAIPASADQMQGTDSLEVSASFAENGPIVGNSLADSCTLVKSALRTDLHNLIVAFPAELLPGLAWKDSVELRGCQTGVPTLSQVSRSFLVTGDTAYQGKQVVIVTRADSVKVRGEGGLQQHRVTLSATGSGKAVYYLNADTGRVVRLAVSQGMVFELTTVERRSHFRQTSIQEFTLAP
jgi:hypothetical protein